jgi:hypothetical protein
LFISIVFVMRFILVIFGVRSQAWLNNHHFL